MKTEPSLDAGDRKSLEIVEERLDQALQETQNPKPLPEQIQTYLDKAAGVMNSLSSSIDAAAGLGQRLAAWAILVKSIFCL